jgi:hypothetical protein
VNECKPLILGKLGETDASGNPVLQNFAKYIKKAGAYTRSLQSSTAGPSGTHRSR